MSVLDAELLYSDVDSVSYELQHIIGVEGDPTYWA
jgi:hypothetical protein